MKRTGFLVFLMLCGWLLCVDTGLAAEKKGFVTTKSGNTIYLRKGKRLKGFQKIRKKKYYFDKKGILQKNCWIEEEGDRYRANEKGVIQTGFWTGKKGNTFYLDKDGKAKYGWQQIKGAYYYFKRSSGAMVKNKTIDGIRLSKRGKARVTSANRNTLLTYVLAQKVVEQVVAPTMSREQALRVCFEWVMNKPYRTVRFPFQSHEGWEVDYANDIFIGGGGTCYSDAAAFAFLANAIGYNDVCVSSSGEHGWTEINGMVYDPLLVEDKKDERYYGQIKAGSSFKAYYQVRIP